MTQLNKTGVPGQVHTASESPLYPLLSLFFFRSATQTRRPTAWADTSNYQYSPSHSYLIMTKNCNSLPNNSTAARCTSASGHWPSQHGTQLCNTTTLIHTVRDPHIGPWPVTGHRCFFVCTWQTPANHYEWITYVLKHVRVIFNFVSFKLLYNIDFSL